MNPLDSVWGTIVLGIVLTALLDALVRAAL